MKHSVLCEIESALKSYRVVSIMGVRGSGALELALTAAGERKTDERRLTDADVLRTAREDPVFFVRNTKGTTLVIDPIENCLPLIGEIKAVADGSNEKAQFIIAGNADWRRLPDSHESLAGRVAVVRTRLPSEAELRDKTPSLLTRLMDGKLPYDCTDDECNKPLIVKMAVNGAYPQVQTLAGRARTQWFDRYLAQALTRDGTDLFAVRDAGALRQIFTQLAAASAKPLALRSLGTKAGIAWRTAETYTDVLESLFLIDRIPAWTCIQADRPSKAPKAILTDSGLMAHLLGETDAERLIDDYIEKRDIMKELTRTWVYSQFASESALHAGMTIHHLHTKTHDIDFIVTDSAGRMLAISVKCAESINPEDFKHVKWFRKTLGDDVACNGIILYAGNRVISGGAGSGCYAVPIASLWVD